MSGQLKMEISVWYESMLDYPLSTVHTGLAQVNTIPVKSTFLILDFKFFWKSFGSRCFTPENICEQVCANSDACMLITHTRIYDKHIYSF